MTMLRRCCGGARSFGTTFAALSRAAARSAAGRLRNLGVLPEAVDWPRRAAICETCPLRVIHKGASYCGRPLLEAVVRIAHEEGCGCPCTAKARDPGEHCPLDWNNRPARRDLGRCDCKWCGASVQS